MTPTGLLEDAAISIDSNGRIAKIATITGDSSVDLDVTLCPGFIDLQVNGIDTVDVASADGADWVVLNEHLIGQGTTTWCPTLISNDERSYDESFTRIAEYLNIQDKSTPQVAGIHLEGPYLGAALGAHDSRRARTVSRDWITQLPPFIKIMTLAPEQPDASAAIVQLVSRGIVASIGHTRATSEQFDAAVASGASMVTHLFNAMSGVHHRENSVALRALTCDQVAVGLIADLVHVAADAINLAFRAKHRDDVLLVTDSVAWNGPFAKEHRIAIRGGAPRLADSTLAGSCLAMNVAIRNVVQHCGIDLVTAVHAASQNPARVLGMIDRGRIQVGCRADFVALDDDFNVLGTWIAGQRNEIG